jgi:hypothetical protein
VYEGGFGCMEVDLGVWRGIWVYGGGWWCGWLWGGVGVRVCMEVEI